MADDIYEKLARHLDDLPGGFPLTESGVEMRILRRLFTPFEAAANPETCKGCGTCVDRCQMEAVKLVDDKVDLNVDRCIGCGLCVTTCPTGSLTLVRRPESEQPEVPRYMMDTAYKLGRARGKLNAANIAMMHVKSKVDRIPA